MLSPSATVCLIGFDDAGSLLGTELAERGCAVRAYDRQLDHPATREALRQRIEDAGVHPATLADALRGAKLVISSGSAAEDGGMARIAALLQRGQILLDLCDVSAAAKRDHAVLIEACGADYVDAALAAAMTTQVAMPLRLGGPRAAELAPALHALGFNACVVSDRVGFARESIAPTALPRLAAGSQRSRARRGELP